MANTDDMAAFLGLEATGERDRWRLPVSLGICGRRSVLYGSCALAAAIEVVERATGRPTAWAACHFLGPAPLDSVVELTVETPSAGRSFAHGRVVGHLDGEEVFAAMAALGERPSPTRRTWASPPPVPAPETAPPHPADSVHAGRLRSRIDERWVPRRDDAGRGSTSDDGRSFVWVRLPGGVPASAAALAVLGDLVAAGTGPALDAEVQAPSLDNTIRVVRPAPCPWVLAEVEVQAVDRGLVHGSVNLWSPDGDLLAITSQTGVVSERRPPAP